MDRLGLFEKTFLFKGLDRDKINCLMEKVKIEERTFSKGDVIYSPNEFNKKIGFIAQGKCAVNRMLHGGTLVPLNLLSEGNSFGIVAVFSKRDEFPTIITAKSQCVVFFITNEDIRYLIKESDEISINVIEFLTRKINFLNDKLAAFSCGSVEDKLASYILDLRRENDALCFDFNKKKSAEALNCGRASLYRAIESLQDKGYIRIDNKKIYIIDLEGLERI